MNLLVVAMAIAAGICMEATITHGMAGLARRPRDRARLAFAIGAIAVAVGSLAIIGMYSTESPHMHAAVMKWVFFPASAVWMVAAVWFVAYYTGVRPARFLYALTAGYATVLVLNLALPFGLLHAEAKPLRAVEIFGARMMLDDPASPHPLDLLTEVLAGIAFAYSAYAVYKAYRRGDRRKADVVALAVLVFTVATVIDTLTRYGIVASFYTTQLCFAAVVLAMSIALRREALRAESELAAYRSRLESMVDERVHDLDQTNEQLALEVEERIVAEESLRQRVQELDGLQRISQTLADRTDLASALDEACGEIARLLKARLARVYLSRPEEVGFSRGEEPSVSENVAAAVAEDAWVEDLPAFLEALEAREPTEVADPATIDLPRDLERLAEAGEVARLLLLPMVARGDEVGVLAVTRSRLDPAFSRREEALAQTVADTLGAVVQNEWLHQRQTRRAAEEERQRLAHDLHDAVTQSIYSASLIAEALPAVWEREPAEGLHNLVRLRRLVRAALAEMRTLLFELRPAALEAAPLCTLLERLGDALSGQAQIPVEVDVDHQQGLPPQVKLALYRVAQEAFSNIAKHAHASQVTASLTADEQGVKLAVVDDGRGFDPRAVAPERMGLRIMRERLDRIGAELEVDSDPGRGTRISAFWPQPGVTEHEDVAEKHRAVVALGAAEDGGALQRNEDTRVDNDGNKSVPTHEKKRTRELSGSHPSAHSRRSLHGP